MQVLASSALGDLQGLSCRTFGRCQSMEAATVIVGSCWYEDLCQTPLLAVQAERGITATVVFTPRSKLQVERQADVSLRKISKEEESLWEEAVAEGSTAMDLESWVRQKRDLRIDNAGQIVAGSNF